MKSFYDLDLKEYRKIQKEFKGTVIGFRLDLLTWVWLGIFVVGAAFGCLDMITAGVTSETLSTWIKEMESSSNIMIVLTIISYSIYQRNFKQFYDEKYGKKSKDSKK